MRLYERRTTTALAAAVAALALVLCGCSAAEHPSSSSTSGSEATDAAQLPTKDAIAKIMRNETAATALGSSDGTLEGPTGTVDVVAEVLHVEARSDATVVEWRLKSASGASVHTTSSQLAHPPLSDTRLLGVIDPKAKVTYRPYTYVPIEGNGHDNECLCSKLPDEVNGEGERLYAVLPPLPASVSSVTITLPGFETLTHIGVTRSKR